MVNHRFMRNAALVLSIGVLGACSKASLISPRIEAPTLSSVSPAVGPFSGGTQITIRGTGFEQASSVSVAGSACREVSFISSTEIKCKTPPHVIARVAVIVTNSDGLSATRDPGFSFVDNVTPVAGRGVTSGGATISNPGVLFQGSAGVVVRPIDQSGPGIRKLSGVQGALFDP